MNQNKSCSNIGNLAPPGDQLEHQISDPRGPLGPPNDLISAALDKSTSRDEGRRSSAANTIRTQCELHWRLGELFLLF